MLSRMASHQKTVAFLSLVALLLIGTILAASLGRSEPSLASIHAAVHERLSETIELSDIEVKRRPPGRQSEDQLILYSAKARIKENYVRKLNPFDWQDQCEGGRDGRPTNKALAGTAVYEIVAEEGSSLTMVGRMKAYRGEDGVWRFTARNRRLMDDDTRISGQPISAIMDALLTNTTEFDELCDSVFQG